MTPAYGRLDPQQRPDHWTNAILHLSLLGMPPVLSVSDVMDSNHHFAASLNFAGFVAPARSGTMTGTESATTISV